MTLLTRTPPRARWRRCRTPSVVVLLILAKLPVDLRARCACVCRGWRAALLEHSLWTRLDVSHTSGVTVAVTDALLRGAVARAGGGLQALDVSRCSAASRATLLALVTANADTLRELRACHGACVNDLASVALLSVDDAEALLRAALQLRVLEADVRCESIADARRALGIAEGLRRGPLRVHGLRLQHLGAADLDLADFLALMTDVACHPWLQQLFLERVPRMPAVLDAVVDAALARRLTGLHLVRCGLSPASAPALARLLGGGVASLSVWEALQATLLDAPAATLLAGALRANRTLTALQLVELNLWRDADAAVTLLGALAAHPSLRKLDVSFNAVPRARRAAVGAALGALLAADAPALTELRIHRCRLGDAGTAPLFEALRANTHLRTLVCGGNQITDAFAADVLLPAVRANANLRALTTDRFWEGEREAEDIVARRAAVAPRVDR
jgi:hypothetical protein